jgi:hypothetical protein
VCFVSAYVLCSLSPAREGCALNVYGNRKLTLNHVPDDRIIGTVISVRENL